MRPRPVTTVRETGPPGRTSRAYGRSRWRVARAVPVPIRAPAKGGWGEPPLLTRERRGSRGCRGGTRCPSRCRDFNRTPLTPAAGQYILKQSTATLNAYLRDRVRVSEPSLQHEASAGGSTSSMTCMRSRPRRQRRNAPASKMSTSPGWLSDGRGLMSLFTRAASCSSTSAAGLDGGRVSCPLPGHSRHSAMAQQVLEDVTIGNEPTRLVRHRPSMPRPPTTIGSARRRGGRGANPEACVRQRRLRPVFGCRHDVSDLVCRTDRRPPAGTGDRT